MHFLGISWLQTLQVDPCWIFVNSCPGLVQFKSTQVFQYCAEVPTDLQGLIGQISVQRELKLSVFYVE